MRPNIFTLTREHIEKMRGVLPEYVIKRMGQPGCFVLGATKIREGQKELLMGICQFIVNKVTDTEVVGELSYTYVFEEYRRSGIGLLLLDKMSSILRKSDVEKSVAIIVGEEAESLGYGLSEEDLNEFLREGEYIPTEGSTELLEVAERKLFAGMPDVLVTNSKRYIKRNV